jgi:DNA-binding MarR family transcriptional regulator
VTPVRLGDREYRELLAFRTGLRRFLRWSDEQAASAGLTGQQHQLLLAIRGHEGPGQATIGDVAEHLLLRHHSAVELVDRAEQGGLVQRVVDDEDRRVVRLDLTGKGRRLLDRLTAAHVEELTRLAPVIARLVDGLGVEPVDDVVER